MIASIACTVILGLLALWQVRRAAHWHLVARILGRDVVVERAKRTAVAMALGDVAAGLRDGNAELCAKAMRAALQVAHDDTDETLLKLGFQVPPHPAPPATGERL